MEKKSCGTPADIWTGARSSPSLHSHYLTPRQKKNTSRESYRQVLRGCTTMAASYMRLEVKCMVHDNFMVISISNQLFIIMIMICYFSTDHLCTLVHDCANSTQTVVVTVLGRSDVRPMKPSPPLLYSYTVAPMHITENSHAI